MMENFNLIKSISLSNNYEIHHDNKWIYLLSKLYPLENQGWKIHISCLPNELQLNIKNIVLYLTKRKYSFKLPAKLHQAQKLAFGGAGYLSVGKQITIYPPSFFKANDLYELCKELTELVHITKFPKITTDIQFKDTPIFLRYGGFKANYRLSESGTKIYQLQDKNGHWVDDIREIGCYAPRWIKIPEFLQKNIRFNISDGQMFQVENLKLINRSAKSSVFSAIYKNQSVIIKHTTKQALIDENGRDSVYRIKHEISILDRLKNINNIPHAIKVINTSNSVTLIENYVSGKSLQNIFKNFPINPTQQTVLISNIIQSLKKTLKEIHNKNIVYRDLAPQNIFYTPSGNIRLIDFELSDYIGRANPLQGVTPGYSDLRHGKLIKKYSDTRDDTFGFGAVKFFLATGINPVFPEAISTITGEDFIKKLIVSANNICKTPKTREIAYSGIKDIYSTLTEGQSNEVIIQAKGSDFNICDSSKSIKNNAIRFFTNKLHQSISDKQTNLSLDTGLLGCLFGIQLLTDSDNSDSQAKELLNRGINTLIQSLDDHTYDNISLFNGSIGNILLFSKNSCEKELNNCIRSFSSFQLDKAPIGLFHGLSGILLICTLSYKYTNGICRQKLLSIIANIVKEIDYRSYHSKEWIDAFDVGPRESKPKFEVSPYLGYGLAGILISLISANKILNNPTIKRHIKNISEELYTYLKKNFLNNTSFSLSLSHGLIGIWLSLLLACSTPNINLSFSLKDIPFINQRENLYPSNFSLKTGYAGCLILESFLKKIPCKGVYSKEEDIKRIIISCSSDKSGRYSWTGGRLYMTEEDSLLTGDLGIYLSLIFAL